MQQDFFLYSRFGNHQIHSLFIVKEVGDLDLEPIDWILDPKAILDAVLTVEVFRVVQPAVELLAEVVVPLAILPHPFAPMHMGLLRQQVHSQKQMSLHRYLRIQ